MDLLLFIFVLLAHVGFFLMACAYALDMWESDILPWLREVRQDWLVWRNARQIRRVMADYDRVYQKGDRDFCLWFTKNYQRYRWWKWLPF